MLTSVQKAVCDNTSPLEGLDKLINQKVGMVCGVYDFASDGGAIGDINLKDENGDVITLPNKAIVKRAFIDIVTAFTSTGGTGTIALKVESAGDILAAVDADTLSGQVEGLPDGTAAEMIKLTAARKLVASIAVAAITAGKARVFVEYVLSE